jgi:hypothetical protein
MLFYWLSFENVPLFAIYEAKDSIFGCLIILAMNEGMPYIKVQKMD